jgi:hypothetical protein
MCEVFNLRKYCSNFYMLCVCVFLIVIHWFRVTINYNMNKGSRL